MCRCRTLEARQFGKGLYSTVSSSSFTADLRMQASPLKSLSLSEIKTERNYLGEHGQMVLHRELHGLF
jgi:hypothetical protein